MLLVRILHVQHYYNQTTVTKNTTVERVSQKRPSMLRESSNVFENFWWDKLTEKNTDTTAHTLQYFSILI